MFGCREPFLPSIPHLDRRKRNVPDDCAPNPIPCRGAPSTRPILPGLKCEQTSPPQRVEIAYDAISGMASPRQNRSRSLATLCRNNIRRSTRPPGRLGIAYCRHSRAYYQTTWQCCGLRNDARDTFRKKSCQGISWLTTCKAAAANSTYLQEPTIGLEPSQSPTHYIAGLLPNDRAGPGLGSKVRQERAMRLRAARRSRVRSRIA
jgi:hypothetical protein